MPRMQLTDTEAALVQEYRRKTEIDRTHNAALELAGTLLLDLIDDEQPALDNPAVRAELSNKLLSCLAMHKRDV